MENDNLNSIYGIISGNSTTYFSSIIIYAILLPVLSFGVFSHYHPEHVEEITPAMAFYFQNYETTKTITGSTITLYGANKEGQEPYASDV